MQENIKEVIDTEVGDIVDFKGVIKSIKEAKKGSGEAFLNLEIADSNDFIQFPIWDKVAERKEILKNGSVIRIVGTATEFSGARQVRVQGIQILDEDVSPFMPKYEIPEELVDYFVATYNNLDSPYKELVAELTGYNATIQTDRWKDFTTCVAAEKGHQNRLGGLFVHSMGVLKGVDSMIINYVEFPFHTDASEVINPSRLRALAIIHDICKIEEYEFKQGIYRKPDSIGHRIKFVSLLDSVKDKIGLSDDDVQRMQYSVLAHHGPWGANKPRTLEDTLLHLADMIDSKIVGCSETGDERERINFGAVGMINSTDR